MRLAPVLFFAACGPADALGPLRVCAIDPPDRAVLAAEGTDLRDASGRIVTLRGINTGGRSKFAPYSPFDFEPGGYDAALDAYLDRAATWGVDVLRVPFSWAAFEPVRGQDDEEWAARFDALLDAAWDRGIWTIVDFHQDVYAEPFCGDGFPAWTLDDPGPPRHDCPQWFFGYISNHEVAAAFDAFWAQDSPVMADFEAMWERMAARHADRPGVIGYEVINEPFEGTADPEVWGQDTMAPFYTSMAARLRAVDPDALVFFDAPGIDGAAGVTVIGRPDGPGLVFAPHYYDPRLFAGGGEVGGDVARVLGAWRDQGDAWGMPVLLGEYGIPAAHESGTPYVTALAEALDAEELHGTYWEYSVSHDLWNSEAFSVVDGDGVENDAVLGPIVRPYVRALAGDLLRRDVTPTALEVDIVSDGGVTEIVLPGRAFGTAPEVLATRAACGELHENVVYVRAAPDRPFTVRAIPW